METNQLRVPTVPLDAEIRYFDERLLVGRIFLPARAPHHGGATRPDEWMNQATGFFPFVPDGGGAPMILNKRYVVVLTVPADAPELESRQELGAHQRVEIECGSLRLSGIVAIEMPENQQRLLDFMNRPEAFLALRDGGRRHLIQKNRITFMREAQGE